MKKTIITISIAFVLMGCKKSNVELEIEHYELQKVKLEYLEALMKTKADLSYQERQRLIDSLITEEKTKIDND